MNLAYHPFRGIRKPNFRETKMMDRSLSDTGSLRPKEIEAVYAISQAVAKQADTNKALDEIIRIVRPVFIFDTIVLYKKDADDALDPTYARAIGRGRFREADLAWGGHIAKDALDAEATLTRVEVVDEPLKDRTNIRHMLGLPLILSEERLGALVFIRFGGPEYTPDQVNLSEFIAVHVSQLLGRGNLIERIAALEAKRRLDSLQDDFISMISHELLTPLGFIKGYATTLLRDDTTWDEGLRVEFLTIIDEEADRLRELIENMIDSSRLQADNLKMVFQPVRLDTLLKDVILRIRSFQDSLKIQLHVEAPGLRISADPTRLAQVFENIIHNAIKYAPGSPIFVHLSVTRDQACVEIRDQGPGIAPEYLDKIFLRFFRAPEHRSSGRGSGLGLYICQRIVQAHNGIIEAQSVVGEGTKFIIYLPREHESANTQQGEINE